MSNGNGLPIAEDTTHVDTTPHHPLRVQEHHDHPPTSLQHDNHTTEQTQRPSLREVCADINDRVTRFLSAPPTDATTRRAQEQTKVAVEVIAQALRDYDFESLSLSYNGGKDCLALLILYLSVLHKHFTQPSGRRKPEESEHDNDSNDAAPADFPTSIPSIYAKPPDPFDAVSTFVESSTQDYHLDLTHISTNPGSKPKATSHSSPPPTPGTAGNPTQQQVQRQTNGDISTANINAEITASETTTSKPIISFRDAFAMYLQAHPEIEAIFVGTRRTDPHGATLQHFQMTDGNWPRFMRIHPVIDWGLGEIWCFLRSEHLADLGTGKSLEYCSMYDEGYTSLGGVGDTVRNPKLRVMDEKGLERYRPAYQMTDDEEERAGRE